MSDHGHADHPTTPSIMDAEARKQLHEAVEQIDHIHREKERKLDENKRLVADFFASLPQFAAEFTREKRKPDYQVIETSVSNPSHRRVLTVNRNNANFLTLTITASATSEQTKAEANSQFPNNTGQSHPLGSVDGKILERLSLALIQAIRGAGEAFNRI